ncbi:MAG: cyclic-di-AMP receptor [Chthonomonas sp.]|nr:cyclic-di-AMP receptor [Chthonomonas sp.]
MKLCVAIVHSRDKNRVADELGDAGFKFTIIGSTSGFLREGNTTFLIGVEDNQVEDLRCVIDTNCRARDQVVDAGQMETGPQGGFIPSPIKVPVGGAVLFVLNVDEFHRY